MDKRTKIIAIVLSVLVALLIVCVGFASMNSDKDGTSDTTVPSDEVVTVSSENTLPAATEPSTLPETTTQVTVPVVPLKDLLLGKWSDSADMSGYEFFADGTVNMTYVNLTIPVINIPINGTSRGVYTLEGDTLTTKFSIYTATIENSYRISVKNNSLSMKNLEDGTVSTYAKKSPSSVPTTETTEYISYVDEIFGSWVNDNASVRYNFSQNSTVKVSFNNANVPSVSTSPLNGDYEGIYLTDGTSIIIQFTVGANKVTQRYDFSVSRNSLSFTDDTGNTDIYIREGTGFVTSGETALMGKWSDGSGMSGYEFKSGGVVTITYVNFTVPVVNIPINGTFNGSYTVDGDTLTVNYSIYGNSMMDTYEYSVDSNSLTLMSPDGKISTYIKN